MTLSSFDGFEVQGLEGSKDGCNDGLFIGFFDNVTFGSLEGLDEGVKDGFRETIKLS